VAQEPAVGDANAVAPTAAPHPRAPHHAQFVTAAGAPVAMPTVGIRRPLASTICVTEVRGRVAQSGGLGVVFGGCGAVVGGGGGGGGGGDVGAQ